MERTRIPRAHPLAALAIAALTVVGVSLVPIRAQAQALPVPADLSYKINGPETPPGRFF